MIADPRASDHLSLLHEIAVITASNDALDEILGPVLRLVSDRAALGSVALAVVDRAAGEVVTVAGHGLVPAEIRRGRYPLGEGVLGRAAAGESVVVDDVLAAPAFEDRTGVRQTGPRSFVAVPVALHGEVVGVLSAYGRVGDPSRDARLLRVVASLVAPAVAGRAAAGLREPASGFQPPNLIGRSKPMRAVYDLIAQVAPSPTTVLLRGESGTGKELVANAIHAHSPRAGGPFVKVNCAALPESIIESELFGHEKGAFTGAFQQRKGRFELARGGTIFLDEIGDLSPQTQIKLLRVLQEREYERVGGTRTEKADVRVIAATSRDLEGMIEAGTFRIDLYYRLDVFPIHLPPLRERRADILLLADHFVEVCNRGHGKAVRRIATSAIDMLMAYHWPGNVRELENCVERAVLLARDDVVHGHLLPPSLQTAQASGTELEQGLQETLDAIEREFVLDALKSTRGNLAEAARKLRITERIMGLRVGKYGIDPGRFKARPTEM